MVIICIFEGTGFITFALLQYFFPNKILLLMKLTGRYLLLQYYCVIITLCNCSLQIPPQDVAVKCFAKLEEDLTAEDLAQIYADVRLEFNKLVSIGHSNIVKCFGFCVTTLSFVLELAPLGSLKSIMKTYNSSGYHVCPSSVVDTIKQVKTMFIYMCVKCVAF